MASKVDLENAKRHAGNLKKKNSAEDSDDSNDETIAEMAGAATTSNAISRKEAKVEKRKMQVPAKPAAQKKQRRPSDDEDDESDEEEEKDDEGITDDDATYCLCHQIAFGEMVLCDNDNCENQWYHFECVDLNTKPKGKWYCPICRGARSNMAKTTTYSNNKI